MTRAPEAAEAIELQRQIDLLQALWQRTAVAEGRWRDSPGQAALGLAAYRNNGRALAERALSAAYPTVTQLVGSESFAALARAFWQSHPPTDGDIATHGAAMSAFIAVADQLADVPYLSDVARLDWAVHLAESAADADPQDPGLHFLAGDEAEHCRVVLLPGTSVVSSPWPVVALWTAHRSNEPDRFEALSAQDASRGQQALVHRDGWHVRVAALPGEPAARFTSALLAGEPIGSALSAAGETFSFNDWLVQALQQRWLLAIVPTGIARPGENP